MGFRNFVAAAVLLFLIAIPVELFAQDIPGIEICTAEKAMDRRTSCLQSNIDFLQKTMNKQSADHQQKLDAANRQIEGLKAQVASLQKLVADFEAQQKQIVDELKKKADVAAKDTSTTKSGSK
jgi:septal ring factor EnvC (AmiA/AmiB activator)